MGWGDCVTYWLPTYLPPSFDAVRQLFYDSTNKHSPSKAAVDFISPSYIISIWGEAMGGPLASLISLVPATA